MGKMDLKNFFFQNMELNNKTILVTGASSGIGRAIAIASAQKGARVVVHYRKNKDGAEQTLEAVKKHSRGFIVQADLTDEKQINEMFVQIAKEVGVIDALVNNAGEATPSGFFDNTLWQGQFDNIFFSALHVAQYFLKQHTESALRKIINITSVYGNLDGGNGEFFAYSAAKAALSSMTITLAKTDPHVLVNAVAPGYTWTPAWEGIPENEKKLCEDRTMIGRYCTSEEVANMVVALLENDAITGQIITVDGGLMAKQMERKKHP